jgi:type I restriction enzyme, S subunit
MATLQPYKKYHAVAYDYAMQLPEGWQLLPNIAIFEERIDRGHIHEELLSVTIKRGVIRQTDVAIKKDSSNEDKSKYKLIKIGDIAYNKMRMWQGALGYSDYQGISSPAYVILKPKMEINPRFFHYMLRTSFYTNYSKRFSYGIVDDQLSLRYTDFKRMYSIVPPLEIQNSIVDYLDKKNNEIDKFIRNKEKLIGLAIEQKRVTINNAITQGINPTASMIVIGLEWLKKMPEHWEIKKWKYVFNIRNGQVDPKRYPNKILLAPNHIESGTGKILYKETAIVQGAESGKYLVKAGDIVYSKIRPELNKVCIAEDDGLCSADMYAIHSRKEFNQQFLMFLFLSESFNKAMVERSMRVAMPKVNREDVKNYQSAFPDADEQQEIVDYIEREIMKLNKVISKVQQEIASIKEYREALITDLVTGKRSIPQIQSS